jgi:hypothetical protein
MGRTSIESQPQQRWPVLLKIEWTWTNWQICKEHAEGYKYGDIYQRRISSQMAMSGIWHSKNDHEGVTSTYIYHTLGCPAATLGMLCGMTVLRGVAASRSLAFRASASFRYSIFSTRTSPSMS